jgi:hypothetical protein
MPHVEHHHEGPEERIGRFRLEMVIAILLGLAALVGAAGAYFGHVAEGHSISKFNEGISAANENFNQGIRAASDSSFFYNQGNQRLVQYQSIFQEYAKDAYQGTKTGDYTFPAYIQTTLMDERLSKMVTWWTTDGNTKKYNSPFVAKDPYFGIPEFAKGAQLDQQASASFKKAKEIQAEKFDEGKQDEHKSNNYTLVEVLIASSLFLYGIASVSRGFPIKMGFLVAGLVLFVLSVAQLGRARWG